MAITYPGSLDTAVGAGTSGAYLNTGGAGGQSHKAAHDDVSAALVALETKVGATGSTDPNSHEYKFASTPIAFVFPKSPSAAAMINVPVTVNLAIAANLAGSAYYNATDPTTTAAVFTLTVQPAGTTIGTINKPTGSGAATFSGSGSSTLAPGNTLRMTATTVDAVFADIGITILATKR